MFLPRATDTEALGAQLATALLEDVDAKAAPAVEGSIHLRGQLGAGKTTLVRGLARALGIQGPIKSPTYTLVEPYACGAIKLYHFDLYRLGDGEELEYLGLRDAFAEAAVIVIEWPERAGDWLPESDLQVQLTIAGTGRDAQLHSRTAKGEALLAIIDRHRSF
jgi:tRNA threonylcarbamoyladenosine biosynthesis protein TsaE